MSTAAMTSVTSVIAASSWTEPSIIVSIVVAASAFLWWAWSYPLNGLRKWVARINDALDKIATLWAEAQPNGGSSMKDMVKGMRRDISRMACVVSAQFHSNPSASMEIDGDGSATHLNHAVLQLLGMTAEEAVNKGWMGALAPGYRQNVSEQLRDSFDRPQRMTVHAILLQRNSRTEGTNVTMTFYPLTDECDKLTGYVVNIESIQRTQVTGIVTPSLA